MKKKLLVLVLMCIAGLAFCKSKKKNEEPAKPLAPVWMTDEGRLSLFPSGQYISAFAFGSDADSAKNKAAEQLSEYVKSHVTSSVNYSLNNEDYSLTQESSVETDNVLYNTEYTTPYYSDYHGMYCSVAYIDRTKAFNYVKPKLDKALNTFPKEYEAALLLDDDYEKVISIKKSLKALNEFYEVYDFARAVKTESAGRYEKVDLLASQASSKLDELKKNVTIAVYSFASDKDRFVAALSAVFNDMGFTAMNDVISGHEKYNCHLIIHFEDQNKTSQTFEIHPYYTVELKNNTSGEVKLSVTRKLNKCAGFDEATAVRRANLAVENDIKNELIKEF